MSERHCTDLTKPKDLEDPKVPKGRKPLGISASTKTIKHLHTAGYLARPGGKMLRPIYVLRIFLLVVFDGNNNLQVG